ncbi:glycoside hydrolase family 127 protein [Flavobacterium sp.]|uniref:glycoside hydrolase family 127 protein n=1 Tax=Flavobacterium sp. TaxID=239 RepID=UPI00121B480F|nr:glycoside hydrolase family 127 protein [Flavobacterium sp.]RZJ70584.1 MAG: glycoside hydrolase family 127 protein [Flavobacterium sp.]
MITNYLKITAIAFSLIFFCSQQDKRTKSAVSDPTGMYPISSVPIADVKVTDAFWLPIIKRVQEKTIYYAIKKCADEGRFDNFLIAGGKLKGEVRGQMPFDDTDVYKIVEGASNSLISSPNPKLEKTLDSIVGIIKIGQEKDGYLTTWRTINPAKPPADWVKVDKGVRWEFMFMSHEDYNAGHLYEAAATHFWATGKRNFLDIALKNADLFVKTFGDEPGKLQRVPGHQIIETGLIKLYQITGKKDYLKLAKYFLDNRGNAKSHELYGEYSQDHIPVVEQDEAVGHAVRATYMYAGMTDIAAIYQDKAYRNAVDKIWENMVQKKMYLTGGIGAKHDGEAFGKNYELPNLTAYNETCAAIGDVYWNERMFNFTGNVSYYDIVERTMFNGLISGMSLTGTEFFYPNALESDGVYKSNRGSCTRQGWFDCSCCPTNLIRFIPAIPGLIYAKQKDVLYVNLYMSNNASVDLNGQKIAVTQQTEYPWNGKVNVGVNPQKEGKFTIKLRIPGWARNEVLPSDLYAYTSKSGAKAQLKINGKSENAKIENGYFVVDRTWKKGDKIEVNFPMEVRKVEANSQVSEDKGKLALEYGPIVYAFEQIDNANNFDALAISNTSKFSIKKRPDLLLGVQTLEMKNGNQNFTAIPYYAWSNRGVGKMKVWLPKK